MPDGSRIINIGSCLAERVPGPGLTLYSTSKAALVGLTKGLARDLGKRGITVNVIEPGPIDTDMNPATGEGAEGQKRLTALGRYGTGNDVAATVAHLASEEAGYITGTTILVDGGFAA
jgi:NAD(P)-dependent dehydrogenase (short-subunit alcohol dehydrogenase family)